jgi:murein DD-endopeptidase MepM/ murein hydrolase activator NlpD
MKLTANENKKDMRTSFRIGVVLMFVLAACGPAKKGIFADRRTEHQKYGDRIKEAGLDQTTLGRMWFSAAERGLNNPLGVTLPYKENGYFSSDKPSAAGYSFSARRGDRITLSISVVPDTLTHFFTELWKPSSPSNEAEFVATIDSTRKIIHDVEDDGNYVVRVQAPLLETVEYTLTINSGPSLAFPVSETGNPRLISFWSDPRDGGLRSHQGVDISAKFRTPAIASADGVVSRVMENRLGGKVVFMRPEGKNYSLYYAHLDSQIVETGQRVTTGQVLGLVGNTGNARGTVPHLHFGIYGWGGAIDPLPFIDTRRKETPPITAPLAHRGQWLRTTEKTTLAKQLGNNKSDTVQLNRGIAVFANAVTDSYVKVALPDGNEGFVSYRSVTTNPLASETAASTQRILNEPIPIAPAIATVESNDEYEVIGNYGAFNLVRSGDNVGWLQSN